MDEWKVDEGEVRDLAVDCALRLAELDREVFLRGLGESLVQETQFLPRAKVIMQGVLHAARGVEPLILEYLKGPSRLP